jgi:hypothetical protein
MGGIESISEGETAPTWFEEECQGFALKTTAKRIYGIDIVGWKMGLRVLRA